MVRFLFAHHDFVDLSDEFRQVREKILAELEGICKIAMWRVRLFSNPFYKNGEEMPEYRFLSVNLEARQPFFRPDGQVVMVWQKDENGERVGDAPLLLKADYCLRVMDDAVQLVTA